MNATNLRSWSLSQISLVSGGFQGMIKKDHRFSWGLLEQDFKHLITISTVYQTNPLSTHNFKPWLFRSYEIKVAWQKYITRAYSLLGYFFQITFKGQGDCVMWIGWLRFTSIYLDLNFSLNLNLKKIWFNLAWFRFLFNLDLDKFC